MSATAAPSSARRTLSAERKSRSEQVRVRISRRYVNARYDAAQTNDENRNHWGAADNLSADASQTSSIRLLLRKRARYEVGNNSYARGIVLTLANDTIGTGPRLQLLTPRQTTNQEIEEQFSAWAAEIGLAEKLRTMRMARAQDGEAFAILSTNPRLDHPVQLDLKLVEADQVSFAATEIVNAYQVDGIRLDEFGNPVSYSLLTYHPGSNLWNPIGETTDILARNMIHIFRADRPGQHRGIPEITPALPLFAQLRRYTLAVIAAAESAADMALVLYSDMPPNNEADSVDPLDEIELERRMMTTLPAGWKLGQVEALQPTTTYAEFKKEILNEIARCLNMPFNIAAGNSSGYNYSSGRLDWQTYYKSIRVDQDYFERVVLNRILSEWLWEYGLAVGFFRDIASTAGGRMSPPHQWFWDGTEHVDPTKEADAQTTRLSNNTTTLARECAREGLDWEQVLTQRAIEVKRQRELGITPEPAPKPAAEPAMEREEEEAANAA